MVWHFWRLLFLGAVGTMAVFGSGCQQSADTASVDTPSSVAPTFNRDIAPLVYEKCATCHRPGEAAPFSLLSYEDARKRASQIAEVTGTRFMPPWLPRKGHGEFIGERRLSDREISLFESWAKSGAPAGDPADLPVPPTFIPGWQLGLPDVVLETPPYQLDGAGTDEFRNFVLEVPGVTQHWVQSIELRPTNPRVTHHARIGVDRTNESVRRDAADLLPGYDGMAWGQDPEGQLVTWTPGMLPDKGTRGVAWRLQPESVLVLHTHMQPTGKSEEVRFRVGIHFAEAPPQVRPVLLRIGSRDIDIPPSAADHSVTDKYSLPIDVDIHFVFPHAHSLCQEVRLVARDADGNEQSLLRIDHFDENWHDKYRFSTPVRLTTGTTLVATFGYDNSSDNARNSHRPPQRTVYGSNADDEMADVYVQATPVRADQRAVLMEDYGLRELRSKVVGYRKTLEFHPQDPWARESLGSCYVALGKPRKAIEILDKQLQLTPNALHSLVVLGMSHQALGEHERAEEHLRQALVVDPDYPVAWLGLGQALAAQLKNEEAEASIRRAIELAPAMIVAHLDLADLLIGRGELEEAAAVCLVACEFSPEEPKPYLKLASIRARQHRYEEGLELFNSARVYAPYTYSPQSALAIECYQLGDEEHSRMLLAQAQQQTPDDPVPELFLGQIARRDGQLEASRNHLKRASTLPLPDTWPASHRRQFLVLLHTERFELAQQLEDFTLARNAISSWLKLEPDNSSLQKVWMQLEQLETEL